MAKVFIGSDHAGYALKEWVKDRLPSSNEIIDVGTFSTDSTDYPDYAHAVAEGVESDDQGMGILICGSANGVAMTANKHAGVRAAICWSEDISELARSHNDANVICIPARFVSEELAWKMIEVFLKQPFEGGRHQRRVGKIACA